MYVLYTYTVVVVALVDVVEVPGLPSDVETQELSCSRGGGVLSRHVCLVCKFILDVLPKGARKKKLAFLADASTSPLLINASFFSLSK